MYKLKINAVVVSVPAEYSYRVMPIYKAAFKNDAGVKLLDELVKTGEYIDNLSLAAVVDGRYVAHALLSRMKIVAGSETIPALALVPAITLPNFRGLGLTRHLIDYALRKVAGKFSGYIVVFGNSLYYQQFGFSPASKFGIRAAASVDGSCLLVKKYGYVPAFSGGTAVYPAAFKDVWHTPGNCIENKR